MNILVVCDGYCTLRRNKVPVYDFEKRLHFLHKDSVSYMKKLQETRWYRGMISSFVCFWHTRDFFIYFIFENKIDNELHEYTFIRKGCEKIKRKEKLLKNLQIKMVVSFGLL